MVINAVLTVLYPEIWNEAIMSILVTIDLDLKCKANNANPCLFLFAILSNL